MKSDYLEPREIEELAWYVPAPYRRLMTVAWGTGFRVDDLCGAKVRDFTADGSASALTLTEEKTGKVRAAKPAQPALCELLLSCAERNPDDYIFRHWDGKPLNRKSVWRWIKRAWREMRPNDQRQISPHSLRKAYAVYQRQSGRTLEEVQRDLNHDRATTTILYYYADLLSNPAQPGKLAQ